MDTGHDHVIFFDLGDTLGTAVLSGSPSRLTGFDVFPFVAPLLERLQAEGLRLGIISNTGDDAGSAVDAVLARSGILQFFGDGALRIYSRDVGLKKDSPEIFTRAATRAGVPAGRCLFVGENPVERGFAQEAGMRVCPHPLLVQEVLDGQRLRFVRITATPDGAVELRRALRDAPVLPLHLAGDRGAIVYGIASERAVARLANVEVDLLGEPDAPDTSEFYLVQDDAARESGRSSTAGQPNAFFADPEKSRLVVSATREGLVIALPPGGSLGELHFERSRHGHTVKLIPDPWLLEDVAEDSFGWDAAVRSPAASALASVELTPAEVDHLSSIVPARLRDGIERYSGETEVGPGAGNRIKSRHINHPLNSSAVEALVRELEAIGQGRLIVRRHRFSHRGKTVENVEAELVGASPQLVLVTAHLDSTAANTPGYEEGRDDAPGADDDASGVAAVLAIAERFVRMSAGRPPARTIRFVLFNAEEEGLVGSRMYARQQRSAGAPILAVFQMDMIAYNKVSPRAWEVHAGFAPSPGVEQRSLALAALVRDVTKTVSPNLELPELYRTDGDPEGDPAAGRSDHASFQASGYAACLASEDFFVTRGSTSQPDENPNYHTIDDRVGEVDVDFAADIARAVAAAAWVSARGIDT
jgi:hypothetical protein